MKSGHVAYGNQNKVILLAAKTTPCEQTLVAMQHSSPAIYITNVLSNLRPKLNLQNVCPNMLERLWFHNLVQPRLLKPHSALQKESWQSRYAS